MSRGRAPLACALALACPLAARAAAPAPAAPPPPQITVEPEAPSPEADQRELQDFLEAHARWDKENAEFRGEVALLIQRKYDERRNKLAETYEAQIRDLETDERTLRKSAIERFEAFITRYPDEPRTTPDAMFRLSELYFEEAKDGQMLAEKEIEQRLKNLGPGEEPPPEPPIKFDKSIALYRTLISKFPNYRLIRWRPIPARLCARAAGRARGGARHLRRADPEVSRLQVRARIVDAHRRILV